jgi:outer membrane biosynthesis protein TonB
MELAVQRLKLGEATKVIDYDGEDPYQMLQVHDYQNVSFLRMNPSIRAASKQTIDAFSTAYPELLREKFFINVPAIMGWMFTAMKVFLSKNTIRKFHPITNGANLAREFSYADEIPKAYGGQGADLKDGAQAVPLEDGVSAAEPVKVVAKEEPAKEVSKEEAKEEPVKTEEPVKAEEPAKTEEPSTVDAPKEAVAPAAETKEEPTKEEATVEPVKEQPAETEAATATAAPAVEETK